VDVSPDIDKVTGIVQNVFQVEISSEAAKLKERFTDEPLFLEVIEALLELDKGRNSRKENAHATSIQYVIEEGPLWHVGGGTRIRSTNTAGMRNEKEAVDLARQEHEGEDTGTETVSSSLCSTVSTAQDWTPASSQQS